MSRRNRLAAASLAIAAAVVLGSLPTGGGRASASTDPHAYFDMLVARPDFWKGYSFRPVVGEPFSDTQAVRSNDFANDPDDGKNPYYGRQLERPNQGGYQVSNGAPLFITYDPAQDRDPQRQDAAKIVIPVFHDIGITITHALSATDTVFVPSSWTSGFGRGQVLKFGDSAEVVTITDYDTSVTPRTVTIARGQHGTAATPHASGASILRGGNSLGHQVRVPLFADEGYTYLFVWDGYWTDSYVGTGLTTHKTFQFSNDKNSIFFEPRTRFDGGNSPQPAGWDPTKHVSTVDVRSYNRVGGAADWSATDGTYLGPGITANVPIQPQPGRFMIKPNVWTRWFVVMEARPNDYDYVSLWMTDETSDPVQIYDRVPISWYPPDHIIRSFWLEFNTSTSVPPAGRLTDFRDLVAYVRNFAALRWPLGAVPDVAPFLQKPSGGTQHIPPPPALPPSPTAPNNLRIVK